ncbi:MAG: branched-chain amino acid ABC transporter permease [Candidatus Hodarchaeota archaeon]
MILLDIIIGGLLKGGIYALLALGFNLQYGVARILNISYGQWIMLGAMGTFTLHTVLGINPLVCLAVCAPILFLLGFVINWVLFERLRKVSESVDILAGRSILVSFGLLFIIENVALLIWSSEPRGYSFLTNSVNILGALFAANRLTALVFALMIGFIFYLFLVHTRLGKAIRAASQNERGARLIGVNIDWVQGVCFALGALLAGLAGVLLSTMFTVSPFMGMPYTIIAIIVVVLGGLGQILGSLAGGLILGLIGNIVAHIEPGLELVIFYMLFVIIILVRPKGIFGR